MKSKKKVDSVTISLQALPLSGMGNKGQGGGGFPHKGTRGAHHTFGGLKSGFDTSYVQPHEVKVEVFGVP